MSFKPINDRVVVKPAPADEKTKGGIIIPDTAKEKPQRGEVIAVGPGKDGNKMTVKKGDKILYGCLLYTSPSPRDQRGSRMPSSA